MLTYMFMSANKFLAIVAIIQVVNHFAEVQTSFVTKGIQNRQKFNVSGDVMISYQNVYT